MAFRQVMCLNTKACLYNSQYKIVWLAYSHCRTFFQSANVWLSASQYLAFCRTMFDEVPTNEFFCCCVAVWMCGCIAAWISNNLDLWLVCRLSKCWFDFTVMISDVKKRLRQLSKVYFKRDTFNCVVIVIQCKSPTHYDTHSPLNQF